jgi:multidrug efflux pump subunit AcrA (membrane-fusion protein)
MKPTRTISKIILYIVLIVIILVIIAGIVYVATPGATQEKYVTTTVSSMDLTQTVTATGEVAPDQQSVLAFDGEGFNAGGGTIATVNVAVGDHVKQGEVLATLKSDTLESGLEGAQADVAAAQAQLAVIEQGATPANIAVYSQKADDAETAFSSAIHDSYLKTEDAVENETSTFFTNSVSVNPVINVPTENIITGNNINYERLVINGDLNNWQNALTSDTPNQVTPQAETAASTTLADAKQFFNDLNAIMNYLTTGNSGFSQTTIDADRATMTGAATEFTAAVSEYTGALSGINEAASALNLDESSATPSTIAAQTAEVAKAQAEVDADQSQINHAELTAPFDGIVTNVEPTVGEVFSVGVPAITVISGGPFKIDVGMPETDVAKLTIGDMASVTLDAYGAGTTFPTKVTTIDPAETVVNGINSYQVTLHFLNTDPRILSGMTANVSIVTATATDVLAIPTNDIITKGTQTFVIVETQLNGKPSGSFIEKQVTTGITGSNGYVEIVSGLSDGDIVAEF